MNILRHSTNLNKLLFKSKFWLVIFLSAIHESAYLTWHYEFYLLFQCDARKFRSHCLTLNSFNFFMSCHTFPCLPFIFLYFIIWFGYVYYSKFSVFYHFVWVFLYWKYGFKKKWVVLRNLVLITSLLGGLCVVCQQRKRTGKLPKISSPPEANIFYLNLNKWNIEFSF